MNAPATHRTSTHGFALVITLLLMAMLVMLMVSMAALTRVEIQIATNSQQAEQARQNALTGLTIALGELQAAAGPDQRISARAEILSDPNTTTTEGVAQPHWTGVWKTGNAPLDLTDATDATQANKTAQRVLSLINHAQTGSALNGTSPTSAQKVSTATWLVSRPTAASTVNPLTGQLTSGGAPVALSVSNPLTTAEAAQSGLTGGSSSPNAVVLAKNLGRKDPSSLPAAGTNPGFIVAAPLVTLSATPNGFTTAQTIGKYAYWIGDEGVKAKVNLIDPTFGANATASASATTAQAHFLAPQGTALNKIAGLVTDPATDFRAANSSTQLAKVIVPNCLKFLPSTPAGLDLKPYLADITTYSRGVLCDVKNGGLKKDLTAALETDSEYTKLTTNYGYGAQMVYRNFAGLTLPTSTQTSPNDSAAAPGITDGLHWLPLYNFYNQYKKDRTAVPSVYGGAKSATSIAPSTQGATGATPSLTDLPLRQTPTSLAVRASTNGIDQNFGGTLPEVISYRIDIALDSYKIGAIYKLRLRYRPQFILYNPYTCRIAYKDYIASLFVRGFNQISSIGQYKIHVFVGGTQVAANVKLINSSGYGIGQRTTAGQLDTLSPGETRVFGLTQDAQPYTTNSDLSVSSGSGMTQDYVQVVDLPSSNNSSAPYWNFAWAGTSTASALVSVTMTRDDATNGVVLSSNKITSFTGGTRDYSNNYNNRWPYISAAIEKGPYVQYPYTPGTWPSIPISSLEGNPRMLAGIVMRVKGIQPTSAGTGSYVNGTQVIAPFHGNSPAFSLFGGHFNNAWREYLGAQFGQLADMSEVSIYSANPSSGAFETFFGQQSAGKQEGASAIPPRRALRDVPNQPLTSLGQFMHLPYRIVTTNFDYGLLSTGSMFVGGSLCNPQVPTTQTLIDDRRYKFAYNIFLDDSYLANDTLFDRFYFSTVPPAALDAAAPAQWSSFNLTTSPTLPNARIKPYAKNGASPALADLRDLDKAAANQWLDGAFNVNSTSIDAWKALLGSLAGTDLNVYNTTTRTQGTIAANTLKNPIPRFWSSANAGATNQPWEGLRDLSDAELSELARSIVQQVKTRGPFLSMSDFLNRRLGAASALTRVGCLQAAIDTTTPDINATIKSIGTAVTATGAGIGFGNSSLVGATQPRQELIDVNLKDGAGNPLNSTVGMPGYLMQQDLVQAFSPAMTVRSDTFVIRTYGEAVNPATGVTQSKAWAEAVVQRLPDFMDSSEATGHSAETALSLISATHVNQIFGRRFKIVGFRWLSADEL